MFSWVGKLFGSDKAAEKLIDTVSSGIDKAFYTSEEKAEDRAIARREGHAFIIEWLKSTTGSRLARRVIALIVTCMWTLQYLTAQLLLIIAVWSDTPEPYRDSARIIGENIDQSTGAMMLILGFYFAAPHMGAIAEAALNKFGKVKP